MAAVAGRHRRRPAVASGVYTAQFIYWLAPIVGSVVAAVLYDQLFLRRGIEPITHGAIEEDVVPRHRRAPAAH